MIISVIISTYNRCESLKDTLDSLLNQERDDNFDYEVIVVDNNSSDKTKEVVVESYMPQFNGRLRYLFQPKQGKSYALNLAITKADGEIIAFTDDDCIAASDWLLRIKEEFVTADADCVLGMSFWLDENGNINKTIRERKDFLIGNGLNMSLKKSALVDVNFFDENLGPGVIGGAAEDMDLIYRISSVNKTVIFSQKPKIYHKPRLSHKHAMSLIDRDLKGYYFFLLKHAITKKDIYALKRIYWHMSGVLLSLFDAVKSGNKEYLRLKILQFNSSVVGLIKGIYIWTVFIHFRQRDAKI